MYLPKHYEETRTELLHHFICQQSFGALVVLTKEGINVEHIPFLVNERPAPLGVLRGHVARANPVWQTAMPEHEAVAVFQGPNHYITPSWYPTKKETGKVVPTWNYAVVHAHGRLRFIHDPEWLRGHVNELTNRHESPRESPWKVSDAPEDYIHKMLGMIVGVELSISRLSGKYKLGQNRPEQDRLGMMDGLLDEKGESAASLAELVREIGRMPPRR